MSVSYWEHPGVSETMWSAITKASTQGEYQTPGGNSRQPWEQLRYLMTGIGVFWISDNWSRSIIQVIVLGLEIRQSARENFGFTWQRS